MPSTIYEAAGGDEAFLRLAHAWHERVLADPIVSHAFSHGFHPDHTARLAAYWAEALGGPPSYTQGVASHAEVVRLHAGNGEHVEMDQRAVACFERAVEDAGLAEDPRLGRALVAYFTWATARMSDYPASADDVPAHLAMAHWGWDGPAEQ